MGEMDDDDWILISLLWTNSGCSWSGLLMSTRIPPARDDAEEVVGGKRFVYVRGVWGKAEVSIGCSAASGLVGVMNIGDKDGRAGNTKESMELLGDSSNGEEIDFLLFHFRSFSVVICIWMPWCHKPCN